MVHWRILLYQNNYCKKVVRKKKRRLNKKGKLVLIIVFTLILLVIFPKHKEKKQEEQRTVKVQNEIEEKVVPNITFSPSDLREGEEIVGKTKKGYLITKLNDIYYIDGVLIVNKTYPLPATFKPIKPYKEITKDYLYGADYIEDYVMEAYLKMASDAEKENVKIRITSGYRSYSVQNDLYNNYVKKDGKEVADAYSARAGYSEHQSGLAFDLNGTNRNFIKTKEGKWLNDNCYKYGFALRYPDGKTKYTGYIYEGWHFRYVGVELATKLYNNGDWLSMEEYYGITSEYND